MITVWKIIRIEDLNSVDSLHKAMVTLYDDDWLCIRILQYRFYDLKYALICKQYLIAIGVVILYQRLVKIDIPVENEGLVSYQEVRVYKFFPWQAWYGFQGFQCKDILLILPILTAVDGSCGGNPCGPEW